MNSVNNNFPKKHRYPIPHSESKTNPQNSLLRSVLIGLGVSLAVAAVIILIFTAVTIGSNDPEEYSATIGIASLFVAAFIGGFTTKRLYKSSPALCGLMCGCLLTVVSLIISIIISSAIKTEATYSVWAAILLRAATIPVSMLGAAVKLHFKSNRHRRHKIH